MRFGSVESTGVERIIPGLLMRAISLGDRLPMLNVAARDAIRDTDVVAGATDFEQDRRMAVQRNGWQQRWTDGRRAGGRAGRRASGWADRRTEGRTDGPTDGRTDGRIDDGRTDGRTDGTTDGQTDGRTDGRLSLRPSFQSIIRHAPTNREGVAFVSIE